MYTSPYYADTVIDLTNATAGGEVPHVHANYYTKEYNSTQHWDRCVFCNQKFNITSHSYTRTLMGDSSYPACYPYGPYYHDTCSCGYNYNETRPRHPSTTNYLPNSYCYSHGDKCNVCGHFYAGYNYGRCTTSAGKYIGCDTGVKGTCQYCKHNYTTLYHQRGEAQTTISTSGGTASGELKCPKCGFALGTWTAKASKVTTTRMRIDMTFNMKYAIANITPTSGYVIGGTATEISKSINGKTARYSYVVDYDPAKNYYQYKRPYCCLTFTDTTITGGYSNVVLVNCPTDWDAPGYSGTTVTYGGSSAGVRTSCKITAKFTDACPNVYVRVLDSDKSTIISDWAGATISGSYKVRTASIPVEVTGSKTIYVQGKDEAGNLTGYQAVTISQIDSKAPVANTVNVPSDWAKNKTLTFSCTDTGSGNVQIAVNSLDDFKDVASGEVVKNGNTYSRTYTFTGDVYGTKDISVYFKDSAGNVTTQFVTISNLDVTPVDTHFDLAVVDKPSTKVSKGYEGWTAKFNIVTTGSPIIGYAITSDTTVPSAWVTTKDINIYHSGKYYAWVKDKAGNVTMRSQTITLRPDIRYGNGLDLYYPVKDIGYTNYDVNSIVYNNTELRL